MSENAEKSPRKLLKAFFDMKGITATADSLRLWIMALNDLSYDELFAAIDRFNKECSDYPTPARLRDFVRPSFSGDEKANLAWSDVHTAIRRYGGYATVTFSDETINKTILDIGGWVRLCETLSKDMHWKQREFVQAYLLNAKANLTSDKPLLGELKGEWNNVKRIETPKAALPAPELKRLEAE